jgi:hypothetical protein
VKPTQTTFEAVGDLVIVDQPIGFSDNGAQIHCLISISPFRGIHHVMKDSRKNHIKLVLNTISP